VTSWGVSWFLLRCITRRRVRTFLKETVAVQYGNCLGVWLHGLRTTETSKPPLSSPRLEPRTCRVEICSFMTKPVCPILITRFGSRLLTFQGGGDCIHLPIKMEAVYWLRSVSSCIPNCKVSYLRGPQIEFACLKTFLFLGGEGNWRALIVTLYEGSVFRARDNFLFYLFPILRSSISIKRWSVKDSRTLPSHVLNTVYNWLPYGSQVIWPLLFDSISNWTPTRRES
jgi:hypothetical protein